MSQIAASRGTHTGGSSGRSWLSQALHNKIIALVLAMIVAVPLLAAPADYSLTGIAALTLETFSLLLLTMLLWRAKWDLRPEQLRTFATTSANVPLLLFLGWVTLSACLAPEKIFSIQYLLQVGAGAMLYFAVAYQFRQSKHLSLLADVLLFLALVVSVGGMMQYQMNDELRASAVFGNPQPLGSFVMLMLPMIAALAIGDKKAKRQIVAQVTLVLMIGCLLLTQGRSAWLGGAAGLIVLALLSSRVSERLQEKSRQRKRVEDGSALSWKTRKDQLVLPALLAVIAVGFVFTMNSQNSFVAQRAATMSQLNTDNSWQTRVQEHWQGGLTMLAQRPLMGWGAGQFPVYQKAFTQMGVNVSSNSNTRISLAEQAHNFYLQTAVELGVVGLALMLAVLICFWVAAWRQIPQMEVGIRRTLLMASTAASVGFAVDAFGSPSWQYAQNSMFLWLILGVGTSCLRPRVRVEAEQNAPVRATFGRTNWMMQRAGIGIALLMSTLLPTAFSAPQQTNYNFPGSNNSGIFRVAFGVAIVGTIGYGLYGLLTGHGFFFVGDRDRKKDNPPITVAPDYTG